MTVKDVNTREERKERSLYDESRKNEDTAAAGRRQN